MTKKQKKQSGKKGKGNEAGTAADKPLLYQRDTMPSLLMSQRMLREAKITMTLATTLLVAKLTRPTSPVHQHFTHSTNILILPILYTWFRL